MPHHLDRFNRYQAAIRRILLVEWDPIGVGEIAEAQDEYDSHVPQICRLLITHVARETLVNHLWQLETEDMGLPGNPRHTEAIADRLLRLRDEMEGPHG